MADTLDVVRIRDFQRMAGEDIVNVYHYSILEDGVLLSDVAQNFFLQVITPMRDIQSQLMDHISLEVEVVSGVFDSYLLPWGSVIPGNVAGEYLPPFVAWGFQLNRTNKLTRNGSKRIAGVAESQVSNGAAAAGAASFLATMATALGEDLEEDAIAIASPAIVRYAPGGAVDTWQPVASVTYRRLTTQNTRKGY